MCHVTPLSRRSLRVLDRTDGALQGRNFASYPAETVGTLRIYHDHVVSKVYSAACVSPARGVAGISELDRLAANAAT